MSKIWYKSKTSDFDDVNSREEAADFLCEQIRIDMTEDTFFFDQLMELYSFIVVDEDDRAECDYCHEEKPVALMKPEGFGTFICEECRWRPYGD